MAFAIRREIGWRLALAYVVVQVIAGVAGVWLAHAMFAEPILQVSAKLRAGPSQGLAEFVATFGLIGAILGSLRFRADATPWIVGLYITSAYWFTASTSFANPAVTIARSLSDTFAGIAPSSVPLFVLSQVAGAVAAIIIFGNLLRPRS
jgi:glycerol uptake facilitator-like aquaporin